MGRLTEAEEEFIAEMQSEPCSPNEWAHFDPPFLRKAYERFLRRGWLEYKGEGRDRQFRWTEAGRRLLDKKAEER